MVKFLHQRGYLMKQLDRIEWKLDTILQKLSETTSTQASVSKQINAEERPEVVLHPFTTNNALQVN